MGKQKTRKVGEVDVDSAREEVGDLFADMGEAVALADQLAQREKSMADADQRRVRDRFAMGQQR